MEQSQVVGLLKKALHFIIMDYIRCQGSSSGVEELVVRKEKRV